MESLERNIVLVKQTTVLVASAITGVPGDVLRWALERTECYPCGWFVTDRLNAELCYPSGAVTAALEYLLQHGECKPLAVRRWSAVR